MTTKQSSVKPMLFTFRQGFKSVSVAVSVILCGIFSLFSTLLTYVKLFAKHYTYDEYGEITGLVNVRDTYHFIIFEEAEMYSFILPLIAALAGVLMAICSFKFITSKKMVNVYYSLGITRTKLFCGNYLSGALLLFIAVFLPLFVTFIGNIIALGFTATLLKAFLFYLFSLYTTSLVAFTITATVFAVVGTTFETAIFSSFILFLPDIFFYSVQQLMTSFLYGNPYGSYFSYANSDSYNDFAESLTSSLSFLSPVFRSKNEIAEYGVMLKAKADEATPVISPDFLNILLWGGICAAIFALGIFFFNKRKAEICGFIGMNRYLNSAVSLLAGFSALSIICAITESLVIGLALGAVAFTVIHLLLEIIVLRDGKKFIRGLYKLPIGLVVSGIIVGVFYTGLFGFSQKLPDISDIQSVAVTYTGDLAEYGLFADSYTYNNSDLSYKRLSDCLAGEFTTENDIKAVLDAHKSITETQPEDRELMNSIQFVYTLKNGTKFMRDFSGISYESYKKLLFLEDCDFFDTQLDEYFKGDIRKFNDHSFSREYVFASAQENLRNTYTAQIFSKNVDTIFNVNFTKSDKIKLLDALYTDLKNRSAEEKYYPTESPVGYIYFPNEVIDAAESETTSESLPFSAQYAEFMYQSPWNTCFGTHITTDMTNTINVLKNLGLYEKMISDPDFVSAEVITATEAKNATIQYDEFYLMRQSRCFVGLYSSGKSDVTGQEWAYYDTFLDESVNNNVIKDKAKIRLLADSSFTLYEQDTPDTGYFVSFRTADGGAYLRFIPDGKLPSGI